MATVLRDLGPDEGRAARDAPALLHSLAALEILESAVRDPKQLATARERLHGAIDTLRRALRTEPTSTREPLARLRRPVPVPRAEASDDLGPLEAVLGQSPAWQRVLEVVARVADTPVTILIQGESGTGKELLARVIHRTSTVARGPFVAVNCGALPGPLLEAELFGHTKGAFTGAVAERKGRFREAHGGTLFLDEIGEIPVEVQAKLLRALQQGEIQRLGQDRSERVSVRVLAATNRDLVRMTRRGTFREDLYFRLAAIEIALPPLRDRVEEILPLLDFFLDRYSSSFGRGRPELADDARSAVLAYPFHGNLRELENVAKHLVLLARGARATIEDLPESVRSPKARARGKRRAAIPRSHDELVEAKQDAVERVERAFVRAALARAGGNVSRAARETGMSRSYLQRLAQALGERRA